MCGFYVLVNGCTYEPEKEKSYVECLLNAFILQYLLRERISFIHSLIYSFIHISSKIFLNTCNLLDCIILQAIETWIQQWT